MKNKRYLPPCSYQGGKQRLAEKICDIIENQEGKEFTFYDLCCGSGAVSMEMVSRGHKVVMIDKGPFGYFWESIGNKKFDLAVFREEIDKLPKVEDIGNYLKELSKKPINKELFVYHYLLLQAGAFGSKQIWVKGNKWCNNTFRNYWKPTATSNRKSPVNPMMPMPESLYTRVEEIIENISDKIKAYPIDILDSIDIIKEDSSKKVIYIDPPYMNTTGYFDSFDIYKILEKLDKAYISEGQELKRCTSIVLSEGRKKGNVSGTVKKEAVKEILNIWLGDGKNDSKRNEGNAE